jgi:hypothetical protein
MDDPLLDMRRFFRNRFEHYMDKENWAASRELDGSRLTLADVCIQLRNDDEPFPWRYRNDMRRLCQNELDFWFSAERTYGDVAKILLRRLEDGLGPRRLLPGMWVSQTLSGEVALS